MQRPRCGNLSGPERFRLAQDVMTVDPDAATVTATPVAVNPDIAPAGVNIVGPVHVVRQVFHCDHVTWRRRWTDDYRSASARAEDGTEQDNESSFHAMPS